MVGFIFFYCLLFIRSWKLCLIRKINLEVNVKINSLKNLFLIYLFEKLNKILLSQFVNYIHSWNWDKNALQSNFFIPYLSQFNIIRKTVWKDFLFSIFDFRKIAKIRFWINFFPWTSIFVSIAFCVNLLSVKVDFRESCFLVKICFDKRRFL